jgi:hypothetical protein
MASFPVTVLAHTKERLMTPVVGVLALRLLDGWLVRSAVDDQSLKEQSRITCRLHHPIAKAKGTRRLPWLAGNMFAMCGRQL